MSTDDPYRARSRSLFTRSNGSSRAPGWRRILGADCDPVRIGLAFAAERLVESAADRSVSLLVRTRDGWDLRPDDARVDLTGESFELLPGHHRATERRADARAGVEGRLQIAIPGFWWGTLHPAETPIDE